MEWFIISVTIITHLVIPILFLFWIYRSKAKSKFHFYSQGLVTSGFILLMWKGGAGWGWFGHWWPYLFIILLIIILYLAIKRTIKLPWLPAKSLRAWMFPLINYSIGIFFLIGIPSTFSARSFPKSKAVHLAFPFKKGSFHIAQGGSHVSMNHHFPVIAQRYALDIVQLNSLGLRANGFLPKDLNKYVIFGADLISPCSGEVISSTENLEDLVPPKTDPKNLLGNNLIIDCDGVSVLLAHLKKDSLLVKSGDVVEKGQLIGKVGNTGNTSEPHLHIHAVSGRHKSLEMIADKAQGVPMLFGDKFLIRNDVVRQP